jgi:hypothetical protein
VKILTIFPLATETFNGALFYGPRAQIQKAKWSIISNNIFIAILPHHFASRNEMLSIKLIAKKKGEFKSFFSPKKLQPHLRRVVCCLAEK